RNRRGAAAAGVAIQLVLHLRLRETAVDEHSRGRQVLAMMLQMPGVFQPRSESDDQRTALQLAPDVDRRLYVANSAMQTRQTQQQPHVRSQVGHHAERTLVQLRGD